LVGFNIKLGDGGQGIEIDPIVEREKVQFALYITINLILTSILPSPSLITFFYYISL
jgi:hypothetical protein